jgi:hypothetical protein
MIDPIMASTPPSLDGIDRRTAYANKKYHSGLIWVGVVVILARLKFSGSPNRSGVSEISLVNIKHTIKAGVISLIKKYGKNVIFSWLVFIP